MNKYSIAHKQYLLAYLPKAHYTPFASNGLFRFKHPQTMRMQDPQSNIQGLFNQWIKIYRKVFEMKTILLKLRSIVKNGEKHDYITEFLRNKRWKFGETTNQHKKNKKHLLIR